MTTARQYPATIAAPVEHELVIKKSRFLGLAHPVASPEDAEAVIARVKKQAWDARHHCVAMVTGLLGDQARSSDDGEPSGTAGMPILEVIRRRELTDVVVVVTRYFGGVKLGAGGLVRAYSDAVSATLDAAPLVARSRMAQFEVAAPHAEAGRWQHELDGAGHRVHDVRYEASAAVLCVAVPDSPGRIEDFEATLASVTAGDGTAVPAGHDWVDED